MSYQCIIKEKVETILKNAKTNQRKTNEEKLNKALDNLVFECESTLKKVIGKRLETSCAVDVFKEASKIQKEYKIILY